MAETPRRAGFVAVLGAPNVGKSTLVNRFVGAKVTIVSPKPQTTRSRVRGICIVGDTQLVLVDTPGIFTPKKRLERAMVHAAWRGAEDADAILLMIDAQVGIDHDMATIMDGLREANRQAIVAVNKVDALPRARLLPLAAAIEKRGVASAVFMVSALNGDGTDDLLARLAAAMPASPWLYPDDQLSDISERLLAAEMTREQLFLQLHDELPYSTAVETERWSVQGDGSVRIEQAVYVLRDSHKRIVLGRGGSRIKAVGSAARAALEQSLGCRVHLFLFVKVRRRWTEDPERYRDLGLEYDV